MPSPQSSSDARLISAEDICVSAGSSRIIENVSLAIAPREIVVLIGPNGSGKTTLLKALVGLGRAQGRITRRPGLRLGYVPQHFVRDLSLPMTVKRLIEVYAPEKGAARAALERIGIAALAGKQVATLSGGEMARVLLARAIVHKPDILLLDEPFAGVDLAGEAALYRLIAELRDEIGCAILLVSHDLHVVMAEADRVICLNRHICCQGAAGHVIRDPAFVQLFGPRIASELALYAHDHDHRHLPTGEVQPRESADGSGAHSGDPTIGDGGHGHG
jgi:zinc transport system ATP-binding protein